MEELFKQYQSHFQKKFFYRALLISVLLHFLTLLVVVYWNQENDIKPSEQTKTLFVSLNFYQPGKDKLVPDKLYLDKLNPAKLEQDKREKILLPHKPNVDVLPELTQQAIATTPINSTRQPDIEVMEKTPEQQAVTGKSSRIPALILSQDEFKTGLAIDPVAINCDTRERQSAVINCTDTSDNISNSKLTSPNRGAFAKGFQYVNNTESFKKDMAKRQSLVQTQEQLYKMINADDGESEFVRSQRLGLSRQIARIDKKYQSVDFIKIGTKLVKKVIVKSRQ